MEEGGLEARYHRKEGCRGGGGDCRDREERGGSEKKSVLF